MSRIAIQPEFLHRAGAHPLADRWMERLLVQELVSGNDFDTRVNVIGDRALAFRRYNRPNDFRASGAGLNDVDPSGIDVGAVRLAFRTAQVLRMPALAVDVPRRDGQAVITEVSYYFDPALVPRCPGHWRLDDETLQWIDESMVPEDAILDDFLLRLTSFRNKF